ncbi:hypothetical protein EMEDMD4_1190029 [Sinorhizobium medicae]|uniref:Uncharacterized protein n=1 Tax=Sinorhizobium medicae TaxID=110321 RepID=A0A508WQA9_9HYPH|nr:hypothetical protein EMEDMD4_1190029 [Sinorhizobium medicae]
MQKEKLKRSNPQGESDATEADRPVSALRPFGDGGKGGGVRWSYCLEQLETGDFDRCDRQAVSN